MLRFSPACAGNRRPGQDTVGARTVQPRVCGEQRGLSRVEAATYGSAPRVRGTAARRSGSAGRCWFSPACAGNSGNHRPRPEFPAVQPRVCGEQFVTATVVMPEAGSAPRVRGTAPAGARAASWPRFSPACAGNSARQAKAKDERSVQPRVCGEQTILPSSMIVAAGSAPRVRGTETHIKPQGKVHRFSPACAGNSSKVRRRVLLLAVQPRVCGEQPRAHLSGVPDVGSAPRVRGTGTLRCCATRFFRFSPACAGNRREPPARTGSPAVQPRVCGEQSCACECVRNRIGSAPRVRGTDEDSGDITGTIRFSPACAGNRRTGTAPSVTASVQPRVCGEQCVPSAAPLTCRGSAPRVRGTGAYRWLSLQVQRFSPACAGNRAGLSMAGPRMSVQPRVCGEQPACLWRPRARCGSAPRVRGTVSLGSPTMRRCRFSPACAGNRRSPVL